MNAPRLDRFGEPLDPIDDDDPTPDTTPRTRYVTRIAELRAILAEAKDRRPKEKP